MTLKNRAVDCISVFKIVRENGCSVHRLLIICNVDRDYELINIWDWACQSSLHQLILTGIVRLHRKVDRVNVCILVKAPYIHSLEELWSLIHFHVNVWGVHINLSRWCYFIIIIKVIKNLALGYWTIIGIKVLNVILEYGTGYLGSGWQVFFDYFLHKV